MKAAPGTPTGAARFAEADDNDWEGVADLLAEEQDDVADATCLPGAAYQSRVVGEGTRLAEVGYQSRLATAEERASPERYGIGDVIGDRYEVLAIHSGTMGVVYGTFDRETKLPRALKTLQNRFATNATMLNLFAAEAATWVRVEKHPFIVRAHSVMRFHAPLPWFTSQFDSQPYVVTEYIRGREGMAGDLRGWLGHPRLTLPVATEMALQIAQGMQHATKRVPGLVHRDLKPANILVDDRGRALVTDFGLAHAAQADAGTPAYMAPEQWHREDLDQRTDLYAFGCILHEMLTGRRLFAAVSLEDWRIAHLSHVPLPPRAVKAELSVALDGLVRRCLAKEISARPTGWDEVVSICAGAFHEVTGQPAVLDFSAYELTASELGNAGYSLLMLGKHDEAILCYDRALAIDPRDTSVWISKGRALRDLQMQTHGLEGYEAAIACYDRALEIDRRNAVAWGDKGIALQDLRRPKEAITCYDHALEIAPRNTDAWGNKGIAFIGLNRPEEALACYDHALDIDPRDKLAWDNKVITLRNLKRFDEVIALYDGVIATDPLNVDAWAARGDAFGSLKRSEDALACYDRAIEIDPRDSTGWARKASELRRLTRYEEAMTCYDHLHDLDPSDWVVWIFKGEVFMRLERYSDALACCDRVNELYGSGSLSADLLRKAAEKALEAKRGRSPC